MSKKKIYCWINSESPGWYCSIALCEDGHALTGHASSTPGWARHDMGVRSDWKHDVYDLHCGAGNWELEWVSRKDVNGHAGIEAAAELNRALAAAEKAKKAG